MVLRVLGGVGIGLVWGWLVGSVSHRTVKLWRAITVIALSTAVLSLLVLYFLNWRNLVSFLIAVLLASLVHAGWRQQLAEALSQFTFKEKH